jgi:hypothetical protein
LCRFGLKDKQEFLTNLDAVVLGIFPGVSDFTSGTRCAVLPSFVFALHREEQADYVAIDIELSRRTIIHFGQPCTD